MTIRSIDSPIEQRHTGKGKPAAISHYDVELNNRQQKLLDQLPEFNSRITVPKDDVSMIDLSSLTAKTGDEFSMFTKGGNRLVIRGNGVMVQITPEEADVLAAEGYTWSGLHTLGLAITAYRHPREICRFWGGSIRIAALFTTRLGNILSFGRSDTMCTRFEEWKDSIRDYCERNGLSYQKACSMAKGSNENMLVLQHFDPDKGKMGLLDETPMPAVLWAFRDGKGVRFEETEYTRQYLE